MAIIRISYLLVKFTDPNKKLSKILSIALPRATLALMIIGLISLNFRQNPVCVTHKTKAQYFSWLWNFSHCSTLTSQQQHSWNKNHSSTQLHFHYCPTLLWFLATSRPEKLHSSASCGTTQTVVSPFFLQLINTTNTSLATVHSVSHRNNEG